MAAAKSGAPPNSFGSGTAISKTSAPLERMVEDLPRYAQVLARVGPTPGAVLLVEAQAERAGAIAERLGGDHAELSLAVDRPAAAPAPTRRRPTAPRATTGSTAP